MKTMATIFTLSTILMLLTATAFADEINIALGQPATASGTYAPFEIPNAFDGDVETYWNAGGYAISWIEVDLGSDTIVGSMRLLAAMNPNGGTSHTISGRTDAGDEVTLWSVSGYTVNGQWLESSDINPTAVRYVRVTTTTTPSWVAWTEI